MKRTMTRTLTLFLALGLVLATAGPAMAAKKDKPPRNTGEFEVTMSFAGGQGLATTSECGGDPITMTGNLDGGVLRADGAELEMAIAIPWHRTYPMDPDGLLEGDELSGCHGGPARVVVPKGATAPEVFSGALWLDFGPGDTVTLKWRFDYYWEFGKHPKNNKLVQTEIEFFELNSTPMPFDGTGPQTVTGDFTLRHFENHVWEDQGEALGVSFELTITPKP